MSYAASVIVAGATVGAGALFFTRDRRPPPDPVRALRERAARERGRGAAQGYRAVDPSVVLIEAAGLAARAPAREAARVRRLLSAADGFGLVPAPAVAAVFPRTPAPARAVPLQTALSWLGGRLEPR